MTIAEKKARHREANRRWYLKDPKRRIEVAREWQALNPDKKLESGRRWQAAHIDQKHAADRRWRTENLDKAREINREATRLWRANNPEKKRQDGRVYRAEHPEEKREEVRRRRARKRGAIVKPIHPSFYARRLEEVNHRCAYCQTDLRVAKIHWDHVVPLIRGGAHAEDNLVPACASCNLHKHTMTGEEFRARRVSGVKAPNVGGPDLGRANRSRGR